MKIRCALLALALPLLAAASSPAPDASCPCALAERELAAASASAAAHRRADLLAARDPRAAAAELAAALELDFPSGRPARALRADLHARRSQLLLQAGEARGALEAARAGLAEDGGEPDAFTALLRLREGSALEALGDDEAALASYARVIEIGKALLARRRGETP